MPTDRPRRHPVENGPCRPAAAPRPRPDGPGDLPSLLQAAAHLAGPGPLRLPLVPTP
jgi:hypothetical protein